LQLLGLSSDDIDIALDDMFGEDFAKLIKEHSITSEVQSSGFGVIKANSEKSKHLETATIRVEDQWIDLVNLRSEKYTENSRVPEIEIGTPEEDAYRRDLTINSMFYNINEQKVEDFTQKGIDDLRKGIIRTPLEPMQTFLDDPLRILRTVRFATRFGFEIDPAILTAAKNEKIRVSENVLTFSGMPARESQL
jgi:tRNA nucleotidyltransferase (CCA-adding enzyme)